MHSLDTLYHFEPISSKLPMIGTFDCVLQDPSGSADSGMQDIAIDKNGTMYGVAKVGGQSPGENQDHVIVSVDKASGHCQKVLVIDKFLVNPQGNLEVRGLSFLPEGTAPA